MSEPRLYKKLKRATQGFDWERHEDKFTSGIPDCSYGAEGVGGWVELKTYDCWPRNPEDPLNFHDLKPQQVNWVIARGRVHPLVFFLVGVGDDDWFLISWEYARSLGKMTKEQLLTQSHAQGSGPIAKEIARVLISGVPVNVRNPKKWWRVKYYYLAQGMEGRPDKWDRIVEADSREQAIFEVVKGFPEESRDFLRGCLTAVRTSNK